MKKIFITSVILVCFMFIINLQSVNASTIDLEPIDGTNTFDYNYLHEENKSHYNMSNRNDNLVGEDVLLTVLTSGLGADASHWASKYNSTKDIYEFDYDKDSVITSLVSMLDYNVEIYMYNMNGSFLTKNINTNYTQKWCRENVSTGNQLKHTILVFETEQSSYSNDYVYSQFDYAVSSIVNDIKIKNNGLLPKINLIGHSRGGIINLLYAMDHPDMVNQIFSLGTPYVGSTSAKLDVEYNDCGIGVGDTNDEKDYEGEMDIVDETLYSSYMKRWNDNYNLYKDIEVHALGGATSFSYLTILLISGSTINYANDYIRELTGKKIPIELTILALTIISSNLDYFDIRSIVFQNIKEECHYTLMKSLARIFKINIDETFMGKFLDMIINETTYAGIKKRLVWQNDGLVNLSSQLGDGYVGFNKYTKIFSRNNCNNSKSADSYFPPVVHNLETKDKTFINYISKRIRMSGKTTSNYLFSETENGSLVLNSYLGKEEIVQIPAVYDGKYVIGINDGAFSGNDYIKNIEVSATINHVGDYVFSDCGSLETVRFYGNVESLGYDTSFSNCYELKQIIIDSDNFKSIDGVLYNGNRTCLYKYPSGKTDTSCCLPNSVIDINKNAFEFTSLETIDLNNVLNIEYEAFLGCNKLANIIGNNVNFVGRNALDSTMWYRNKYNSHDGIIALGGAIVGYNDGVNGNVSLMSGLEGYKSISSHAFNYINSLDINIPSSIVSISKDAFANINNLNIYVCMEYNNIEDKFLSVSNLEFNCINELYDYYSEYMDDVNKFDGIEGDRAYRILKFKYYRNDDDLYVDDVLFKLYKGDYIDITTVEYKDSITGYSTYNLAGLYYDSALSDKYQSDIIGYNECDEYYAKWVYVKYSIIFDFDGGTANYYNQGIITMEYSYYAEIGLLDGTKPHCFGVDYWKAPNGGKFYIDGDYVTSSFISCGLDIEERCIVLTAKWEYLNYTITYHEYNTNGEYEWSEYYQYYNNYVIKNPKYGNGLQFYGWYDDDYINKYENSFKEKYYGQLDLYGWFSAKGTIVINNELKITDDGRYNNSYDTIYLKEVIDHNLTQLKNAEYNKIDITIRISLKEIDSGYQHIYLYSSFAKDDNYLLDECKIDYNGSSYGIMIISLSCSVDDLESAHIYIRFDASGKNDDDWKTNYRIYEIEALYVS